jgi:hypothetical protein
MGSEPSFFTEGEEESMSGTLLTPAPENNGALVAHEATPMALIQAAIEKGYAPDQLSALMDLQERFERNRAAEAFGAAITKFQQDCPPVHKSRSVNAGQLNYNFAGYEDVMRIAGPHLAECGIALGFSTENREKGIRVTLRIRVGIHAEESTLDVPIPDMRVNDTQRYGAALSYAKRYALCAALNIVVTDEDDDAQSCIDPLTGEQALEIEDLLDQHGLDKERFKKFMGVDLIGNIPSRDYAKAKAAIHDRIKQGNGRASN